MNNFVLTDKGAVIEITNNSTEQIITNNEGFISPTLTPLGNTVSNEIKPAFTIQIPSFVSYKINNIAPGDSISFVVTKPDEVFYYLGIANSKIEGISVSVTPITDDTTLQDKTIVPTTEEQVVTADEGYDGLGTVTVEAVSLQDKTVTPTTEEQTINADEGYTGLGTVTVEAINLQDKTVSPETEQQTISADENYNGLNTVTINAISLQDKTVTPTTSQQTISANEGYSGLGTVTVEAVTASIDENITAENIKKDVEILGVTGSYEGSGGGGGNATLETTDTEFNYTSNYASLLTSIEIPDGTTSIGNSSFYYCSVLISVTIPNSVETIGDSAFIECSSLTSVTIGNSVTSIGDYAFDNCSALSVIEFLPTTPPDIQSNTFGSVTTNCVIYVPNGTLSAYTSAEYYPDPSTYTYIERPAT